MPEPIEGPVGTPEHIRHPVPRRDFCDCGLLLSEAEREEHACRAAGVEESTA